MGVRFGGYHASAGLGGLLTGDAAKGGLHAEAGTPFGPAAGAGLGGIVDGANGKVEGIKYKYYILPGEKGRKPILFYFPTYGKVAYVKHAIVA